MKFVKQMETYFDAEYENCQPTFGHNCIRTKNSKAKSQMTIPAPLLELSNKLPDPSAGRVCPSKGEEHFLVDFLNSEKQNVRRLRLRESSNRV
jgi:hypothetical protein